MDNKKASPEEMKAVRRRMAMRAFERLPESYRKQLEQNLMRERPGDLVDEEALQNYYQEIQPRSQLEWQNRNMDAELEQMREEARQEALKRSAQANRDMMAKQAIDRMDRSGNRGSMPSMPGKVELPFDDVIKTAPKPMSDEQGDMTEEDASQWGTPQQNRERAQRGFENMGRIEALERLKKKFK